MLLDKDELKQGLTPEQIQAIETTYTAKEAELRALANKNADAIFNGAAQKLSEFTGVSKTDTEKYSDYFIRLGNDWLPEASKKKLEAAEEKVRLAEEKFNNHKGDETLKEELRKAKEELAKVPDIIKSKEDELNGKYKELETTHKTFKFNKSITDAMPKIDDNVNPFEAKAKKQNAIDRIKNNYELSYDENDNLIATKDYQKHLVSDLLKNDEELKDIILTDQGKGGGAGSAPKTTKTLNIPEGMPKPAAQQLIREYLITVEKIDKLDDKFADRFKELCKENNVL